MERTHVVWRCRALLYLLETGYTFHQICGILILVGNYWDTLWMFKPSSLDAMVNMRIEQTTDFRSVIVLDIVAKRVEVAFDEIWEILA